MVSEGVKSENGLDFVKYVTSFKNEVN